MPTTANINSPDRYFKIESTMSSSSKDTQVLKCDSEKRKGGEGIKKEVEDKGLEKEEVVEEVERGRSTERFVEAQEWDDVDEDDETLVSSGKDGDNTGGNKGGNTGGKCERIRETIRDGMRDENKRKK
jgi:hypothetical protein